MSAAQIIPVLDRFLEQTHQLQEAKKPKASKEAHTFLRKQDRAAQKLIGGLSTKLQAAFDDVGLRAQRAYAITPHIREAADPNDAAEVAAILHAMGLDDWQLAELSPLMREHYLEVAVATFDNMDASFDLSFATNIPDPVARRVVSLGGRQAGLVDITAQTRSALFNAIADARADGLGTEETGRLIRQYVPAGRFTAMEAENEGSGVRYRSDMIARTETLNAQRVSTAEAGNSAGFTRYLAFDNRTGFDDEECTARDGQTYTYDEMLSELANEHPNGTLSFSPVPGSQA